MTTLPTTYEQTRAGQAKVTVSGVDISAHVTRFSLDHGAGTAPQVFLELNHRGAPEVLDVEAVVHIREVVQEDPADAMLRFIEPLDPEEFQAACLRVMELGGPATFGEAALHVLRAYAAGQTP